jgi:uncharacterized protein YqjF (DUF2071 family)
MHATQPTVGADRVSESARRRLLSCRGEPLFYADWDRALFLHYEVDPESLQKEVPFPLDLREGRAYVSVVAFTMRGMRLRFGGKLGEWFCRPIGTHEFLNVRTYVRHRGESGIYFLAEWLPNPVCARLGPLAFGLPYRLGRIRYDHHHESRKLAGSVTAVRTTDSLRYTATLPPTVSFERCPAGSLDEFLLERYTAFTSRGQTRRFFRVWHHPWMQTSVEPNVSETGLLVRTWKWFEGARLAGANYSSGAREVSMGWPHTVAKSHRRHPHHRLSTFFELP